LFKNFLPKAQNLGLKVSPFKGKNLNVEHPYLLGWKFVAVCQEIFYNPKHCCCLLLIKPRTLALKSKTRKALGERRPPPSILIRHNIVVLV